jgi:4-hydroxybenzoate polyprenyltransferase
MLLVAGVVSAGQATSAALAVAVAIASLVVLYDAHTKRYAIAGPLNMGLCRGLNLLLGIAAVPAALSGGWPIALISVVYIAAVTTVSRGEVHGGKTGAATFALISLCGVLLALVVVALGAHAGRVAALVLVAVLGYRVLPPFRQVLKDPRPPVIRRAVKAGVLSLVLVDAAIGAAYAGPLYGAAVLATALVAGSLARLFSVT